MSASQGLLYLLARIRNPPPLHDPRYRVTVKWGRNLEPWIADVQLLMPTAPLR